jgi:hypothetical protein
MNYGKKRLLIGLLQQRRAQYAMYAANLLHMGRLNQAQYYAKRVAHYHDLIHWADGWLS